MKAYLLSFANQLRNFSLSLDKTSILVDKPWAMIDNEFELQKLIFKRNRDLIMSKNGQVTIGQWDYLAEAKSLLIDRGFDKILLNERFVDDGVIILKKDGTENKYFALANENKIPDLDVLSYLFSLREKRLNLKNVELDDGTTLAVSINPNMTVLTTGNPVYNGLDIANDGSYPLRNRNINLLVKNGLLHKFIYISRYLTDDGMELTVELTRQNFHTVGDAVKIHGEDAPDGIYKIKDQPRKFVVENSCWCKLIYLKKFLTKDGIELIVEMGNQDSLTKGDEVKINGEKAPDGDYKVGLFKYIYVRNGKYVDNDI